MEPLNLLLLAGALLVFISLLAGALFTRLGLPFLLVFLFAGMLVGEDGPVGVHFESSRFVAWIGNTALAMILIEGGLSTRMDVFRKGFRPALALATIGVMLTAAMVGAMAMAVMHFDWRYGLLLGAIVGSTDAAAVFSVLRQGGVRLNERVSAALELESGLNDPMAVFLVLAMISVIKSGGDGMQVLWLLISQAGWGLGIGLLGGRGVALLLRRVGRGGVNDANDPLADRGGLLALLIVSGGMAIYALCGLLEGSGFLAVYLYGLRVRALAEDAAHAASSALDGFAWAAQATMFLLLGLLVTPSELLHSMGASVAIAATLIFVARPLAVWLCLLPLRFSNAQRLFIGWVGLRGAVPIVLALFPLIEGVEGSQRFFDVAFAVVLASLLLQGTTLGWVARRLGVAEPPAPLPDKRHPVQGSLTLDAELPLAEVLGFFQLPVPDKSGPTLRHWLTDTLARGHVVGDGLDWHGARFEVSQMVDGRIARVTLALAPRGSPAEGLTREEPGS